MTELPNRLLRDALEDAASNTLSPTCVDVDTLAAWAEGTMRGAERAAVDAHAAGCARCLALLAAMARTEPAPIERAWWRRSLVWLLPLATATAALVIVARLAVIEQRPPAPAAILDPRPPAAPPQATTLPAPPARAVDRPANRAENQPTRAPAFAAARPTAETLNRAAPAQAAAPSAPPTADAVAKDAPAAAPEPAPAPPPPPAAAEPTRPSAQAGVTSAVRDELASSARARGLVAQPMMKAAAAPVVIGSPDPDSRWRLVEGAVEHTADGGLTWQPQSIGIASAIRAGAAPAARVCWLVGAGGVVLRTVNGATWLRIGFPEPADLVAVQATDASHASVSTAAGHRFSTTDGGVTWIPR